MAAPKDQTAEPPLPPPEGDALAGTESPQPPRGSVGVDDTADRAAEDSSSEPEPGTSTDGATETVNDAGPSS